MLLWISDKGLEIYNLATFDNDKLRTEPVLKKLETYYNPPPQKKNQILIQYQLWSLKQGNMSLEEFIMKAKLLIDEAGYIQRVKDEMLRDTLVFGLECNKD